MKILLIKSPLITSSFVPLGLGYLGSVAEAAGHDVRIFDMAIEKAGLDQLQSLLSEFRPEIVGITCMNTEINWVLEIASTCKKCISSLTVIVGGPAPSATPEAFLSDGSIDFVVIGEGEKTFAELLNVVEASVSVSNIKGIGYREANTIKITSPREPMLDLDAISFPAYHLLKIDRYFQGFDNWFGGSVKRATNIISTRGCPNRCIYCDKHIFGNRWRGRSAKNVVDEIQFLNEQYQVDGIFFNDDLFTLNKRRVYEICDEIEARNLKIKWGCNSRVNHADRDLYSRMHEAGCMWIAFGIESGDQEILDFMNRHLTLEQVRNAVEIANDVGFKTIGYFMTGMLGETEENIRNTINFAKELRLDNASLSIATPYPGTELYKRAKAGGFIVNEDWTTWDRAQATINMTQDLSKKQLERVTAEGNWELFWSSPARHSKVLSGFFLKISSLAGMVLSSHYGEVMGKLDRIRRFLSLPIP